LSLEMSSCSLAGRVNFGPLLVNLEFGERKGKGQLNFTCNLLSTTALHIHLDTWMLDQGEAAKPVTVRRPATEDWPSRHIYRQCPRACNKLLITGTCAAAPNGVVDLVESRMRSTQFGQKMPFEHDVQCLDRAIPKNH
jgi:hypothetical protein